MNRMHDPGIELAAPNPDWPESVISSRNGLNRTKG